MNEKIPAAAFGISLEKVGIWKGSARGSRNHMEFHVSREVRDELGLDDALFCLNGNVILPNFVSARVLAHKLNEKVDAAIHPEKVVKAGQVNAMGLIDEILHFVIELYREKHGSDIFSKALASLEKALGKAELDSLLTAFTRAFPPVAVYKGRVTEAAWLSGSTEGIGNRELALEELLMLWIANDNPAFKPFARMFDDTGLREGSAYLQAIDGLKGFFADQPTFGPDNQTLVDMLKSPAVAVPHSLPGQLEYIRTRWGMILGRYLIRLLTSLDLVKEEEKAFFPGPGPTRVMVYDGLEQEYERFSPDKDWMPNVVMIAKSTLVWLSQLSEKYNREITRLDQIPDEELDILASRGFTALWLIGVWERSNASKRIKQICGNPEAAASAYSLFDDCIAYELGGWEALENLRHRAGQRGLRLAADMVPNHTGMDSKWVRERPDLFVQTRTCPFPGYSFNGENLSQDPNIGVFLEDHYYSRTDAAVVFKRVDFRNGDTRYIYHGNDGTSMPWNDTAQLDFLNADTRKAVMDSILHVAKNFPIIRFDAAMVLARKHIRRLWFPEPGSGGDIASRSDFALTRDAFDAAMPNEFWREVVDLCAKDAPDTLLLAEAFWMLEGYFVRTLGMHRVYNSAFMNMLKREENAKYRSTIKNTLEFDPQVLKRFVNFLNNPDEETAVAQFGRGDKYFGVTTMMITMPGLPMFGHGQVEGFEEKYGMEYRKAYWKEVPDQGLVARHEAEIFPLMRKRYLFGHVDDFLLYDLFGDSGGVNENVFAYSNRQGREAALVVYNNAYAPAFGWIRVSAARLEKNAEGNRAMVQRSLGDGLGLVNAEGHFVMMREQRSGLWFVRDSRDVCGNGLCVVLNGYQCQVFLDVHDVADDARGSYRKLCNHLNGRGVRDIQAAIQDIHLGDLYSALYSLASKEFFSGFRAVSRAALGLPPEEIPQASSESEPQPKAKAKAAPKVMKESEFVASIQDAALAFFGTAQAFMDGSRSYEAFVPKAASSASTAEELWASLSTRLSTWFAFLKGLSPAAKAEALDLGSWATARLSADSRLLDYAAVAILFLECAALAGNASDPEDGRRLIDHWCLDRKLREALTAAGVPESEAGRAIADAKAVVSHIGALDPVQTVTGKGKAKVKGSRPAGPADVFAAIAVDKEARGLMGVNTFNEQVWFNKEGFENFLWALALALSLDTRGLKKAKGPLAGRVEAVSALVQAFRMAEAASEYRFDKLGELISGE